jgi:hypothetical protein
MIAKKFNDIKKCPIVFYQFLRIINKKQMISITLLTEPHISKKSIIMLNIFLKKAKTNQGHPEIPVLRDISDQQDNNNIGETRHYPPASQE